MTDARLKEVAGLKSLQTLNLRHTEVTDEGIKDLAKMQAPRELDVSWTKVTDAGLKDLAGLPTLQTLDLRENKVTDAGLKDLAGLKTLWTLDLSSTGVTDVGLKNLAGLLALANLNLLKTGVTRAGIAKLQKALPDLKILSNFKTGTTRAFDKGDPSDTGVAPNALVPATKLSVIPPGCTVVFNGTKAFLRNASGGRKPMPDGDYRLPNGEFLSVRGHKRVPGGADAGNAYTKAIVSGLRHGTCVGALRALADAPIRRYHSGWPNAQARQGRNPSLARRANQNDTAPAPMVFRMIDIQAVHAIDRPLFLRERDGRWKVSDGRTSLDGHTAFAPAYRLEDLGDATFRADHRLRYRLRHRRDGQRHRLGRHRRGDEPGRYARLLRRRRSAAEGLSKPPSTASHSLGDEPQGFNLIHSPNEPDLETPSSISTCGAASALSRRPRFSI